MDYSGIDFLRGFLASNQEQPAWGGAPGQEVPPDVLEKMNKPGTPPPPGFFDDLRRKFGQPGAKQAASFDLTPPLPHIDDPVVDGWVKDYNLRNPGQLPPNLQQIKERARKARGYFRSLSI
jgi:hypothetical protein